MDKKVLKIFLLLFFVFTVFQILNDFNVSLPFKLGKLTPSYISVVYVLTFCFAYQNGDEDIAKIGIFLVIINFILSIISLFFMTNLIIKYSTLFVWIGRFISITNSINGLLYFVVLFNLINSNDDKVNLFKMITILLSVILIVMNILGDLFFKLSINKTFIQIHKLMSHILFFAEYSVFFFYLIIKDNDTYINSIDNSLNNNNTESNISSLNAKKTISTVDTINVDNSEMPITSVESQSSNISNTNSFVDNMSIESVQSNNVTDLSKTIANNNVQQVNESSLEDFMNLPSQNNNNNNNM